MFSRKAPIFSYFSRSGEVRLLDEEGRELLPFSRILTFQSHTPRLYPPPPFQYERSFLFHLKMTMTPFAPLPTTIWFPQPDSSRLVSSRFQRDAPHGGRGGGRGAHRPKATGMHKDCTREKVLFCGFESKAVEHLGKIQAWERSKKNKSKESSPFPFRPI